jgi:hypothetical protein
MGFEMKFLMRKRHRILFFTLVFSSFYAEAQSPDLKKLETRIEAFRQALLDPTAEVLDGLVMENLSYGHSSGRVEDKKDFVENLLNGNSDFTEIVFSEQKITIEKKTAIVRHKLFAKTHDKGKAPGEVNLHIMTVWVKTGKTWKLLARQAVKQQ